jgi:phosphatidate cytidylyltransferase
LLLRDVVPEFGFVVALAVLLAIFADDTAAYFGGRALGRHKLAPAISPGKTWEGFLFGMAAAIFVVFVALYHDRDEFLSIGESLLLGIVVALAAPVGDLFESMLKRDMGVKDSGRMLAGHGGVLDRIDAILFAFPAAYFTVVAFLT